MHASCNKPSAKEPLGVDQRNLSVDWTVDAPGGLLLILCGVIMALWLV